MTSLGNLLAQGGWAMWPIYLCSLIALGVFIQRWLLYRDIRASQLSWLPNVLHLIRQQQVDAAIAECENHRHPIAHVLSQASRVLHQRPDRVAAEAERVGHLELQKYEQYLPMLSFIAQIAPLLGLLGTVVGMVEMFMGLQNVGMANVNASALASGIWQALLTTAAGLIVAAPTLAAHLYLTHRVDMFRGQLRDAVEQFLTALPLTSQDSQTTASMNKLPTPASTPHEGKLNV